MRSLVLFVLALAALIPASLGEEERPRWNVTAECQMVTLPQKTALALLPELSDDAKIEAGFAKVQKLIETGEAKLIANLVGRALDGEKGVAESIDEVRYATEFDSPKPSALPAHESGATNQSSSSVGIIPTAFETRHVGAMFEFIAGANHNAAVLTVSIVVRHVLLERWRKFVSGVKSNGEELSIEQPQFEALRTKPTQPEPTQHL